jgi:hypothetical protein
VQAAFNEEITKRDVKGVLATEREKVMQDVRSRLADEAKSFGIEIVDVRIKRVDFVADITDSVYRRMESERKQVANELRSQGAADGEKIRADADRQREVIIAEAYRDAQKIKGEGDAKASALYADAFGRDPQFAQFYRSLEAYRATFRNKSDVMVIDPSASSSRPCARGPARRAAPRRPERAEAACGSMWGLLLGALALMLVLRRACCPSSAPAPGARCSSGAATERRADPLHRPVQHARRSAAADVLALSAVPGGGASARWAAMRR